MPAPPLRAADYFDRDPVGASLSVEMTSPCRGQRVCQQTRVASCSRSMVFHPRLFFFLRDPHPADEHPAWLVNFAPLMRRANFLVTDQTRMRVLSIEPGSVQEVKSPLGSLSSNLSPRYVFHTLVPPQRTKHSLHFVSRAYDKPEINERSSVDPRVLMEPIQSVTE